MESRSRKRPPALYFVLVPILSVVVTLGGLELLLALIHPVPHPMERNMVFEPDPYTGYRLKPNSESTFQNGIPATTNRFGHRDDETTLEKPPGVFRILLLGDSFTVGANVLQEEAYPQVLEDLLSLGRSTKIEVINTAVGGWDPFQYAQYYAHYGHQFDPDLILVGFFVGNDTYKPTEHISDLSTAVQGRRVGPEVTPWIHLRVFLSEHSHLARLLLNQGPVAKDFTRQDCDDFDEQYLQIQRYRLRNHRQPDEEARQLAEANVDLVTSIGRQADVSLVVALLPDENQVNPALQQLLVPSDGQDEYDFGLPQSLLREAFRERGVEVIDLLDVFQQDSRCLYMNDTHWNPDGHRLAAEVVAQGLAYLLPD